MNFQIQSPLSVWTSFMGLKKLAKPQIIGYVYINYLFSKDKIFQEEEGNMRLLLVMLCLFVLVMAGCSGTYTLKPEDKALMESAINAGKEATASAASAKSDADKASQQAQGATQSAAKAEGAAAKAETAASKAESAADRAERAANRAEKSADDAALAAEKSIKAFEMKQRK